MKKRNVFKTSGLQSWRSLYDEDLKLPYLINLKRKANCSEGSFSMRDRLISLGADFILSKITMGVISFQVYRINKYMLNQANSPLLTHNLFSHKDE